MSGNSGPKSTGIPAWQRAVLSDNTLEVHTTRSDESTIQPQPANTAKSTGPEIENQTASFSSSKDIRIDEAKRFLVDKSLQNASLEEKRSFLESKGVDKIEIDEAMKQTQESSKTQPFHQAYPPESPKSIQPPRTEPQPPALPNRDVPPIITYPEFLVHAQKPPPLITVYRLLNTAYIAAGVGAAVYGASKYLVTPMTDSLTEARRDFASHVQEQVEKLNTKLRSVTSTEPPDPASLPAPRKALRFKDPADDAASDDSSNSDPTELFHRDFGTQTSPAHAHRDSFPPSSSSSSASDLQDGSKQPSASESHTSHLSQLANRISAFSENNTEAASANAETSAAIRALNEYLEGLAYPAYVSSAGGGYNFGYGGARAESDGKPDEASKIKTEIRSVKGVLLSAKNFPGSGAGWRATFPSQQTAETA